MNQELHDSYLKLVQYVINGDIENTRNIIESNDSLCDLYIKHSLGFPEY